MPLTCKVFSDDVFPVQEFYCTVTSEPFLLLVKEQYAGMVDLEHPHPYKPHT